MIVERPACPQAAAHGGLYRFGRTLYWKCVSGSHEGERVYCFLSGFGWRTRSDRIACLRSRRRVRRSLEQLPLPLG